MTVKHVDPAGATQDRVLLHCTSAEGVGWMLATATELGVVDGEAGVGDGDSLGHGAGQATSS